MILDHAILGLLNLHPLSGYELKKAFDSSIQHFWTADQSHIYRVLGRLNSQGLVEFESIPQEGKPNRKVYRVTPQGEEELLRWLRSNESQTGTARNPHLVHLFFASLVNNDDVLHTLQEHVERLEGDLAQYEKLSERSLAHAAKSPSRKRYFSYLTIDYGIWMTHAHLAWLDTIINRISEGHPDSQDWAEAFQAMLHSKVMLRNLQLRLEEETGQRSEKS